MIRVFRAACLATLLAVPPLAAAEPLSEVMSRIVARDWPAAAALAQDRGPVAADLVEWHRLRAGEGTVADVAAFLARRPDWPGLPFLRQKAEEAMGRAAPPPGEIIGFFAAVPPATGTGALAYIDALRAQGETTRAEEEALRVWRSFSLTPQQQERLMALHGRALAPAHEARLDAMLWRGLRADAERMLPLVGEGPRRLAQARLGLQGRVAGVDALVAAVPAALSDDPGLGHDRFAWRMFHDRYDPATELILERSTSAAALGEPASWATRRALLARRELREGDPARAYQIASRHYLEGGGDYADLEWLAGFIALRRLDQPDVALRHFRNLRAAVSGPISLSRAGYWEGRAHEALDAPEDARAAYHFAAEHQTTYYGLLAAERVGLPMDPALTGQEQHGDWRQADFMSSTVIEAALLLHGANEGALARRFMLHLAEGLDATGLGQLTDLALAIGEANTAILIAKQAAARGIILPRPYFPVTGLAEMDLPVPAELALAIARRESEFDHTVVSPAGARGLMQVMPGTAEMMARKLGLPYEAARLTRDADYNARLGAAYLAELIEEFGPNPVLVAAGYNAGPGRPRRWVETLGDPRAPDVDPVDWVESVPFTETRTYIMRVMESLVIYRARLSGTPVEIALTEEMKAR